MRALFGLRLRGEVNLYRREFLLAHAIEHRADGFFGNTELLIRAVRAGARAVRIPVRVRPRVAGRSTGRDLGQIWRVVKETAKLRARLTFEALR